MNALASYQADPGQLFLKKPGQNGSGLDGSQHNVVLYSATYTYDRVGNLVRIELPNGLVTTHAYDNRHRLTRITTRDAVGTVLEDVRYTLDATGKRVRVDEQNGAASRSTVYTYDATYQPGAVPPREPPQTGASV